MTSHNSCISLDLETGHTMLAANYVDRGHGTAPIREHAIAAKAHLSYKGKV
jgi:hypothetical protein